jgi:hypothetical protein
VAALPQAHFHQGLRDWKNACFRFRDRPIYYAAPLNYSTTGDAVNLYGVEFGTDKPAHIFQPGFTYYRTYGFLGERADFITIAGT